MPQVITVSNQKGGEVLFVVAFAVDTRPGLLDRDRSDTGQGLALGQVPIANAPARAVLVDDAPEAVDVLLHLDVQHPPRSLPEEFAQRVLGGRGWMKLVNVRTLGLVARPARVGAWASW